MATTLTGLTATVQMIVRATAIKAVDLSAPQDALAKVISEAFTFGTGASKSDLLAHDIRPLALSTSEDLDLAGGLTDAFGDAATFATIHAILVRNVGTAGAMLEIGAAAANQFVGFFKAVTDILKLDQGQSMLFLAPDATGWVVTAGTGDLLKMNNVDAGQALNYEIVVLGEAT